MQRTRSFALAVVAAALLAVVVVVSGLLDGDSGHVCGPSSTTRCR